MHYIVSNGIPIPPVKVGQHSEAQIQTMIVGDSFSCPERHVAVVRSMFSKFKKQHEGWDYTSRRMGDEVRSGARPNASQQM